VSYRIRLCRPNGEIVVLPEKHTEGSTYVAGGTSDAELNVTYNYAPYFRKIFPVAPGKSHSLNGVRSLYGMTAEASIPVLEAAIAQLGDDVDPDYWKATEGNAKKALQTLLMFAKNASPNSMWEGD
jgi:hypothetical protein